MMLLSLMLLSLGDALNLKSSISGGFGFTQQLLNEQRDEIQPKVFQLKSVSDDNVTFALQNDGRKSALCYKLPDKVMKTVFSDEKDNNFLEMVNLMEFVQTNGLSTKSEDAVKYFNVSVAAMKAGNTYVAQENVARALSLLEKARRRKRDVTSTTWNASNLFNDFKERLGDEQLKELLHLNKRVTMAFVIDTSSSMENDMDQVREYISQLVAEQKSAGVNARYIVTTFSDPLVEEPMIFKSAPKMQAYLKTLQSSIGGDCEERTCNGILKAITTSTFAKYGNAAMFVFTDASSKDCERQRNTIIQSLSIYKASAYFVLFDSCKPSVDTNYVDMALKTGGFSILIQKNGVYNVTDVVNGAFENDALIFGEHSDTSNSVAGQGVTYRHKKRSSSEELILSGDMLMFDRKDILIDTSIEKFKIEAQITPEYLLSQVTLEPPISESRDCNHDNMNISRSESANNVIIDVKALECPCTGIWALKFPREAESFSYSIKSSGDFLVGFKGYFVDEDGASGTMIANYAPCLGKDEYMVIKLNQREKVDIETLSVKIVGVAGNTVHWEGQLAGEQMNDNTFVVKLVIPPAIGMDGFRIVLEGALLDGTLFRRTSTKFFYPTASCYRLLSVDNHHSLTPKKKTYIELEVSNNGVTPESYNLICSNTAQYDVSVGSVKVSPYKGRRNVQHSNPVYLKPGESGKYVVGIRAPIRLKGGRTVTVICKALSMTGEMIELIRLTEMNT